MRKFISLIALIIAVAAINLVFGRSEPQTGSTDSLLNRLKNPDANARAVAATILGKQRDRGAVPALIEALNDPDALVRASATEALGDIGDPAGMAALRGIQKDRTNLVREKAGLAFVDQASKAGDVSGLLAALEAQDDRVRIEAIIALGRQAPRTPEAIPELIKALRNPNIDFRKSAAYSLSRFGELAVPALIRELENADSETRHYTIEALGDIGHPAKEAIPELIRLLSDDSEWTRHGATVALGKIGAKEAISPLETLLTTDKSDVVREAIVRALGMVRDETLSDTAVRE